MLNNRIYIFLPCLWKCQIFFIFRFLFILVFFFPAKLCFGGGRNLSRVRIELARKTLQGIIPRELIPCRVSGFWTSMQNLIVKVEKEKNVLQQLESGKIKHRRSSYYIGILLFDLGETYREIYNRKKKLKVKREDNQGNLLNSIYFYKKYIEHFPSGANLGDSIFEISFLLIEQGRFEDSLSFLLRFYRGKPHGVNIFKLKDLIGNILFLQGKYNKAMSMFLDIHLKTKSCKMKYLVLLKIAWCEFILGNQKKAISYLKRIVNLNQGKMKNRYPGLSRLLDKVHQSLKSIEQYRERNSY